MSELNFKIGFGFSGNCFQEFEVLLYKYRRVKFTEGKILNKLQILYGYGTEICLCIREFDIL